MNTEELFRKYPYYIHPAISALEGADAEERKVLLRRIAVGVGPETALRTVIGVDPEEFKDFYGDLSRPELDTNETISEFLDRFDADPAADVTEEEIPVAAPAIDYAATMLAADDEPGRMADDDTADMLNSFLGNSAPAPAPAAEPEPLSEALVRIMIKNGNYRKALEIITELNLKNPKKSIYFADQIRFLNILIKTQEGN